MEGTMPFDLENPITQEAIWLSIPVCACETCEAKRATRLEDDAIPMDGGKDD
jgi:hypothetical protein